MHTSFSSDSNAPAQLMIESAISHGLKGICITDHFDMDFPPLENGMDFQLDTPSYLKKIKELQQLYKDSLDICIGVEMGIIPSLSQKLNAYFDTYWDCFDYVISSTHLVSYLDPYYPEFQTRYPKKEGIRIYFETNLSNMKTCSYFDSFGHLDYVVRYLNLGNDTYLPSDYMDYVDAMLHFLIDNGKGLELNTAGFKAGLPFAHPHPDILKRYKELGGELITIGSDAHKPEHVAYAFKEGLTQLADAGFHYYMTAKKHKFTAHSIER